MLNEVMLQATYGQKQARPRGSNSQKSNAMPKKRNQELQGGSPTHDMTM